jgi:hypothetical protein
MYIMLTVDCYNLEIRGSTMRSNKPVKIIECEYATCVADEHGGTLQRQDFLMTDPDLSL